MILDGDHRSATSPSIKEGNADLPPGRTASGLPAGPRPLLSAAANPAAMELTAELLAQARGINVRNARSALRACPVIRRVSEGGRPHNVHYVGANPRLAKIAAGIGQVALPESGPELFETTPEPAARKLTADDLKVAQLRAMAVRDYLYWKAVGLRESEAAARVVTQWQEPQTLETRTTLHARMTRSTSGTVVNERGRREVRTISVGGFSIRTLQHWTAIWNDASLQDDAARLRALAPARKGASGRAPIEIPDGLLDLVMAFYTTSCRCDVKLAVDTARKHWLAAWPVDRNGKEPGYDTWRRRLKLKDPDGSAKKLGSRGLADHSRECLPSVAMDRSEMRFNEEWQLDDVTQDWYALNPVEGMIGCFRPRLYVVIRVATRQWICAVASIAPITQDQVRAMIGTAMASASGGIPERIKFERGAVACDEELKELLTVLGVRVEQTGMHGGSVVPGAFADRATGNFQGKGIVESAIKRLHRYFAFQPGQVGTNERETAPMRTQTLKAEAEKLAAEGKMLLLPTPDEMHGIVRDALNQWNDDPHGSLRETIDPETLATRHLTPNEWARQIGEQQIRVLDQDMLPLFLQRGAVVKVTANGIRIQNEHYGRFDDDVLALRGQTVRVFVNPDEPSAIYVEQLARCVERYDAPKPGEDTTDLLAAKARAKRADRNQLARVLESARNAGANVALESLQFTANPTPNRALERVCPQEFRDRQARHAAGRVDLETRRAAAAEVAAAQGSFEDRRNAKYDFADA